MTTTRHLRGILAAPRTRQLAQRRGVDLRSLRGTGPNGRILERDLNPPVPAVARPAPTPSTAKQPLATHGPVRREAMSPIEKATARHMAKCWATIPHVTLFRDVDATRLEAQRQAAKRIFEKQGLKLTVTAILAKLVANALRKHPRLNASLDEASDEIVYHQAVNLGIATDTDRGLVVPVIADVDHKSLGEVAGELTQLVDAARGGKLRADQMRGGTFTISNMGTAHSGFFTPIVNHPEVAILGVSAAKPSVGGTGGPLRMPLSLSFDHRVLNGADAARFLETLADGIAEPLAMLLI